MMKRKVELSTQRESSSSKRSKRTISEEAVLASPNEESLPPDNSESHYFKVRKDLKELFNSPNKGLGFSFLGGQISQSDVKVRHDPITTSSPNSKKYSRNVSQTPIPQEKDDKYFFFHCCNDVLRNRLEENSFVRSQSLEELEAGWPDRRTAMKHCFRKRHKEAMKVGKRYMVAQRNKAE